MVMRAPQRATLPGLPQAVTIYEVGARDGLQNEQNPVSTEVKLEFIDRLADAGLQVIEVAGFVRPGRVPQLDDAEELMGRLIAREGVRYPVLVPNLRGLGRALDNGARDIAVFAAVTESFSKRNLNASVAESLETIALVVDRARSAGVRVRAYASMVFGDPWEGEVPISQVVDVAATLMAMGCDDLSLGDTIGVGTPGHVAALVEALVAAGVPIDRLGVHFHDTYGQALANVLAAMQAGVTTIDSSAGGLGGCPYAQSSTGNLATEDLVWQLQGLGIDTGVNLESLVRTGTWMAGILGRRSPSRTLRVLTDVSGGCDG
jgi:hydroxymethylglutaryl-CoA lyase